MHNYTHTTTAGYTVELYSSGAADIKYHSRKSAIRGDIIKLGMPRAFLVVLSLACEAAALVPARPLPVHPPGTCSKLPRISAPGSALHWPGLKPDAAWAGVRPRLAAVRASSSASGRSVPWRAVAFGAGGGALVAIAGGAGPGARASALLLQFVCLIAPLASAIRLYRNGKKRAALTVALSAAGRRFCNRWWQYLTIPLAAGAVGWVTNKIAVDMIFKPVEFAGLRLKTWPNEPLGLFGWQGIVPAKAAVMAERLTDMVTTKLLNVRHVFGRLEPDRVSELLAPGVDRIAETVVSEMVPPAGAGAAGAVGRAALRGLPADAQEELAALRHRYVAGLTRDMQRHVDEILDVNEVVVGGMVREKRMLVELFQRCGRVELRFLVNSGFGFGCLLGLVQMVSLAMLPAPARRYGSRPPHSLSPLPPSPWQALWIFYELPWTLAAGGAVVGYLTNWIALKLIFEPVEPTRFGPFVLQGLFLKRQAEVSEEFADAMTERLLKSESLWHNVLTGTGSPRFAELLRGRTHEFMAGCAAVLYGGSAPTEFAGEWWSRLEGRVSTRTLELLPTELALVHPYVDEVRATPRESNCPHRPSVLYHHQPPTILQEPPTVTYH